MKTVQLNEIVTGSIVLFGLLSAIAGFFVGDKVLDVNSDAAKNVVTMQHGA